MAKVLIAGATGLVGGLALDQALADPRVSRVIALTRRPIAPHAKLENVVIDFAAMPTEAPWWKVDGVVSALGTTRAAAPSQAAYVAIDSEYPLAVARQARNHGATRFALATALGADQHSWFTYARTKGKLERDVTQLGFASLTIVRPSVLDGQRERRRLDERMANLVFRMLAPVLPRRMRVSSASAVAAALLNGAIEAPPGIHLLHNEDL